MIASKVAFMTFDLEAHDVAERLGEVGVHARRSVLPSVPMNSFGA